MPKREHPCVHVDAFCMRGRAPCKLQQSMRVGSAVCVFVGATAGGGAVWFYRRLCFGPLIGLTACHCSEWYM